MPEVKKIKVQTIVKPSDATRSFDLPKSIMIPATIEIKCQEGVEPNPAVARMEVYCEIIRILAEKLWKTEVKWSDEVSCDDMKVKEAEVAEVVN